MPVLSYLLRWTWNIKHRSRVNNFSVRKRRLRAVRRSHFLRVEPLEDRHLLTLLGQQLFPADNAWNQNVSSAPLAANSAAIIAHIGASIRVHPDWGADDPANGTDPLYGIPVNIVHGNRTAKINVVIDNYPDESDIAPVPIPTNPVIESLLAARDGEPSLLDGTDIRSLQLGGLSGHEIAELVGDVAPATTARLRRATGGNPLALQMLARAAAALGMEIEELGAAEAAGLVRLGGGNVEFRHPLVRSAVLAIRLAGASDRRAELAFALSGIAWLQARQGRTEQCRAAVREALEVCRGPATRFCELWTTVALADLELSLGNATGAAAQLERQRRLIEELGLGDVDLWPAAELVESYLRLGRVEEAGRLSADYLRAATAKGQPWSLARAHRCQGLTATDGTFVEGFEQALGHHALTPDTYEMARTRLVIWRAATAVARPRPRA